MLDVHLDRVGSRSYDGLDIDLGGAFIQSDRNPIFCMQRIQETMRRFFLPAERSTSFDGNRYVPELLVHSEGRSKRLSICNLYSLNEPLKIRYPKYCVDNRPSDCEYAKMCQDVYLGKRFLEENDSLADARGAENWEIYSIQEEPSCHYFSATYVNDQTQQIVVVYRGAEKLENYLLKKREEGGAAVNLFSLQKRATFTVVKSAVDLLKEKTNLEKPYHLSFTGHSSGAFLAQLSVAHAYIKFGLMNVYAVIFEDLGAKESLESMQIKTKPVDLDELDITSYVSRFPNGINAHFGTLCLISPHLEEIERPLNELLMEKKESKKPETMERVLALFKKVHPHIPSSYIIDQSSFGQKNAPSTDLENKKGWRILKKPSKRNTNVKLAHESGFKCYPDLSILNDLPLRNFSPSLRKFLKDFDNKKSKSSHDEIRAVCQELNIPEELTDGLIHYEYREDIQIIRLRGGNIREFRANLSRYLAHHSDKILKCMPICSNLTNPSIPLWGVPPKNESFIERAPLKKIKDSLKASPVVVCDGSSGMGKTELALEFVWENYHYYFKTVWFNAESIEGLLLQYDKLGKELNLPSDEKMSIEERGFQVKDHLEGLDTSWLLVYDNLQSYDESEGVGHWIPSPSGGSRVLITSCLSQGACASILIDKFSRDESIKCIEGFLDNPLSEKEKQAVPALVETLEDFPLGIVQAGAYIRENKMSVSDYLERYKERKTALLQDKTSVKSVSNQEENPSPSIGFGRNVVCVTSDLSIGEISKKFPLAENWLRMCSYLGDDIPDFLFKTFPTSNPLKDTDQMLETFNRYSILKRNGESKTVSMHSLLREVIQIRGEKSGTKEKTIITAAHLLQKCVSKTDELKKDETKVRQLLPHFEVLLPKLEEIFNKSSNKQTQWFLVYLIAQISLYVCLRDLYKKAELVARKLAILEQQHGKDSIELVPTLIDLRKTYHILGNRDQERLLLEQLRSIQEKYYGKDHVFVGKTLIALSKTYGALGDPHKQNELLKQVDSSKIKDRNARDPLKQGIHLRRLGNVQILLGEMDKGKEWIEKAHSILEESDGKGLQFSIVLKDLANVYGALGDPLKQKEIAEQARFILEKCWEKDCIEMAQTLITLGTAYGALGDWQKQRELLEEQALPILKQNWCKDYSIEGKALIALGKAYGALGNAQKEWELLQRAVAMLERYYGQTHFEVAVAMGNLANACANLWKVDEAEKFLKSALSILQDSTIKKDFEKAKIWVTLGRTYNILKNPDEGRKLLQQALPILKKHYGENHFEVAIVMGNLGNAYGSLGNIDQAKKFLEKALPILENHYGSHHFEVAITLGNLGNVYSVLMIWNQAKKSFERALPILKEHYGKEHVAIAKVLVNLANACIGSGESSKARKLIKEALPILSKDERANHSEIDLAIKMLGDKFNPLKDMHRF